MEVFAAMADYRYKVEIKLDDEKIRQEKKYDLDSIYNTIRQWFNEKSIDEVASNNKSLIFTSSRQDDKVYGCFALIKCRLMRCEWFRPYVSKMLWYNTDEGDGFEDVLYEYKQMGR